MSPATSLKKVTKKRLTKKRLGEIGAPVSFYVAVCFCVLCKNRLIACWYFHSLTFLKILNYSYSVEKSFILVLISFIWTDYVNVKRKRRGWLMRDGERERDGADRFDVNLLNYCSVE